MASVAALHERSPADKTREDRGYRRVTLRLIPFLFCCYVVAYLDRVNVGFATLQMLADLRMSDTTYGIGAGIFFIGYFAASPKRGFSPVSCYTSRTAIHRRAGRGSSRCS